MTLRSAWDGADGARASPRFGSFRFSVPSRASVPESWWRPAEGRAGSPR